MNVMTVKTIGIICASKVMAGGAANDIEWGGSGNGKEANSREGRFWDEE